MTVVRPGGSVGLEQQPSPSLMAVVRPGGSVGLEQQPSPSLMGPIDIIYKPAGDGSRQPALASLASPGRQQAKAWGQGSAGAAAAATAQLPLMYAPTGPLLARVVMAAAKMGVAPEPELMHMVRKESARARLVLNWREC
jgi:hypothetical protein